MQRGPSGSRLRLALLGVVLGALLAACGARLSHWSGGVRYLPASEGWAELPVGNWLPDEGARISQLSFCPREACVQQGVAAFLDLQGREARTAGLLASDPARWLAGIVSERRREALRLKQRRKAEGATRLEPLAIGAWRGAAIALEPRGGKGRTAHLVALAEPGDRSARILISVAETAETAQAQARRALGY